MANNRFNKQVTPKGYKMGGRVSKMGGGMMKRPMYKDGSPKTKQEKNFKITKNNIGKIKEAIKKGVKWHDDEKTTYDEKRWFKMGGRVKKMGGGSMMKKGGSLKPVDKEKNPGLSKLPTKVRNKMGFMKKGGKVK
jgi:hypothetical protein